MTTKNYEIRLFEGETIGYMVSDKASHPDIESLKDWVRLWRKKNGDIRHMPESFELIFSPKRILIYHEPYTTYKHFIKIIATGSITVRLFIAEKDCYRVLELLKKVHGNSNGRLALSITMKRISIDVKKYAFCKYSLKKLLDLNYNKIEGLKLEEIA